MSRIDAEIQRFPETVTYIRTYSFDEKVGTPSRGCTYKKTEHFIDSLPISTSKKAIPKLVAHRHE